MTDNFKKACKAKKDLTKLSKALDKESNKQYDSLKKLLDKHDSKRGGQTMKSHLHPAGEKTEKVSDHLPCGDKK